MKNVIIGAILFFTTSLTAQSNTDIIKKYVKILYVERPDLPKSNSNSYVVIDNDKVLKEGFGFTTAQQSRQSSTKIKALINKMLAPVSKGGDEKLQRIIAALLQIKNQVITIELYADFSNAALEKNDVFHTSWGVHKNVIVSKISNRVKENAKPTHSWIWPNCLGSVVKLGEAYLRIAKAESEENRISTIVHELSHSQDDSAFFGHFGPYYYGIDSSHFVNELFANFNAAYKEGIANAFAFYYVGKTPIQAWHLFEQDMMYEQVPTNICSTLFNDCLDNYLTSKNIIGNCSQNTCRYKINELPTPVLLHNEYIQASIFFGFMEKFGIEALTKILKTNQSSIKEKYGFPIVFDAMMKSVAISPMVSSSNQLPIKLYPIALLDYTTNWSLNTIEDYRETLRRLECKVSDTNYQEYSAKWRNKYIRAVNQSYVSGIPSF